MTLAQEIYESLLKDPDLDVGENQTREEFAKQESEYRARQHHNNVEALSLANQPLKEDTPVINLLNYVKNLSKTISTASISIIQNIIKEIIPGGNLDNLSEKYSESMTTLDTKFSSLYKQMPANSKGKTFLDSLAKSNLPSKVFNRLMKNIDSLIKKDQSILKNDTWWADVHKSISENTKHLGGENNVNKFHNILEATGKDFRIYIRQKH